MAEQNHYYHGLGLWADGVIGSLNIVISIGFPLFLSRHSLVVKLLDLRPDQFKDLFPLWRQPVVFPRPPPIFLRNDVKPPMSQQPLEQWVKGGIFPGFRG
jgi:hypothetical protein